MRWSHGSMIGAVLVLAAAAVVINATPAAAQVVGPKERCAAAIADESTATMAQREAQVPSRFLAQIQATGGGVVGGGFGGSYGYDGPASDPSTMGAGWNAAVRGDVDLLHPLWLGGTLTYISGMGRAALQLDALAGLSFRRYGPRWVPAGVVANEYMVAKWDGHCQLRREESTLFGGFKTQLAFGAGPGQPDPRNWFALQVGYLSTFKVNNLLGWSVAGLWDPYHGAYGGQFHMGGTGLYSLPRWLYMGMQGGALVGGVSGVWATLDLGVKLEI